MAEQYRKEKRSIFKRWWFWVLLILLILILGNLFGDNNENQEPTPQEQANVPEDINQNDIVDEEDPEEEPVENEEPDESDEEEPNDTETQTEDVSFSNVLVQSDMGMTMVYGEVTNNDTKAHSFTVKVSFYDNNESLIGTATGAVNDLNGGETKIFSAIGTDDVSNAVSQKVQVDTMVETKENLSNVIAFSKPLVRSDIGMTTVDVETTNNDTTTHSFTVNIGFYDGNNKLIGVATGAMNDLGAGDTKTLSAIGSGDFSNAATNKVFVDTMVE